jgi:hypothetical protein
LRAPTAARICKCQLSEAVRVSLTAFYASQDAFRQKHPPFQQVLAEIAMPSASAKRFHTTKIIRDRVEPTASSAMAVMSPRAEVNSEH